MSSPATRLVAFLAVLVLLFVGGAVAGRYIDADAPSGGDARAADHGTEQAQARGGFVDAGFSWSQRRRLRRDGGGARTRR